MKFTIYLNIILVLIFKTSYAQKDASVIATFSKENKKKYFQGEAIVLDLIINNKSNDDVLVCSKSYPELYSKTYNKFGDELKLIAPSDFERYETISSHKSREGSNDSTNSAPLPKGCDFGEFFGNIIPGKSTLHYTKIINNCIGNHYCSFGGYEFPLPLGEYEYTMNVILHKGTVISTKFEFEVISPTPQQSMYLKKIQEVYDLDNFQPLINLFHNCSDADIRSKIISILSNTIYTKDISSYNFWLDNLDKINSDPLLIQQLNSYIDIVGHYDDPIYRASVYQSILTTLQHKHPGITEVFLNKIKFENLKKENKIFKPMTPEQVSGLETKAIELRRDAKKAQD